MAYLAHMNPNDWSAAHARHLLNRAGFGVPHGRVAELFALGLEGAVARMMAGWPGAAQPERPDFLIHPDEFLASRRAIAQADPGERALINQAHQRREREALETLKAWWLEKMWTTAHPLQEKMALFWHGHFATSAQKVRFSWHTWDLNQLFREKGLGPIPALTVAVGQSPVMLDYLDNRKSTKDQPNENWARELMELFTLGQGAYTETDIKESARAFTGWTSDTNAFRYQLGSHDFGEKTFLGRRGHFDGWDIIQIIFEEPAAATFLARKLWHYFAGDTVNEAAVEGLARCLVEHNFDVTPALKALFLSEAFYSSEVQGTQIKSPVQFMLQLCADLGLEAPPYFELAQGSRALGQDLFYPPNVKGWDGNRAWINANSLLIRYNLPPLIVQAALRGDRRPNRYRNMESTMMEQAEGMSAAEGVNMMEGANMAQATRGAAIREALQQRPREERRALREALRDGPDQARNEALKTLGIAPPAAGNEHPIRAFQALAFSTAGECVAALAARFLVREPSVEQSRILLEALGASEASQPLALDGISDGQRFRVLRLLTSMAEYQLC